jgi:hypothetical protein
MSLIPKPLLEPSLDCQPAVPPGRVVEKTTLPNVGNPGKGNEDFNFTFRSLFGVMTVLYPNCPEHSNTLGLGLSATLITSEAGSNPTTVAPSRIGVTLKPCPQTARVFIEMEITFRAPITLPTPSPGAPHPAFFVRYRRESEGMP